MKADIWSFKTQGQLYHKYRPSYPPILYEDVLKPLVQRKRYLDIGVGTGKSLFLFCENFEESIGIDVSESMLTIARSNAEQFMKSHPNSKIMIWNMDARNLKLDGEKFDLVTAGEALFYFPGEEPLRKIRNSLNKDGMFIALNYHLGGIEDPKEDVYFQDYWNKIVSHFAFDIADLATHFVDPIKYPFESVFDKVERKSVKHYVELTKEQLIASLKTVAACNLYQAKTGIDPTLALAEGITSQRVIFRYDCSRITCFKLRND